MWVPHFHGCQPPPLVRTMSALDRFVRNGSDHRAAVPESARLDAPAQELPRNVLAKALQLITPCLRESPGHNRQTARSVLHPPPSPAAASPPTVFYAAINLTIESWKRLLDFNNPIGLLLPILTYCLDRKAGLDKPR